MDEVAAVSARQIVDDAHRKATHQHRSTIWLPMKPAPPVTTEMGFILKPP